MKSKNKRLSDFGPPLYEFLDTRLYLDYQKAFDTVPHQRLLSKMKSYNINSNIIEWTKHYLSNRTQYVELNLNLVMLSVEYRKVVF